MLKSEALTRVSSNIKHDSPSRKAQGKARLTLSCSSPRATASLAPGSGRIEDKGPPTTTGSTFSAEKDFVSSGDLPSTMENPTVSTQKEVISTETVNTIEQTHTAVLSESPLSVPEEGHIHVDANGHQSKKEHAAP